MSGEEHAAKARASDGTDEMRPRVSVIIPHLDDTGRLAECVAALELQTLPRDAFEIVVADNGSKCGIDAVRAAAPGAIVVEAPEPGAGPARNAGVRLARGHILAFTDADCHPHCDWLLAGFRAIERGADIAGGAIGLSVINPKQPTAAECFERVFSFDNAHYIAAKGFSVTANLFVRRDVFQRVGAFASGVPEDFDWCRRARRAGFAIVYVPEALVFHPARQTYRALVAKWDRLTREAYADHTVAGGGQAQWLMRAAAVLFSPVVHAWRVAASPHLGSLRERAAALVILLRIRLHRAGHMIRLSLGANGSGPKTTPPQTIGV